ncbi:MAG: two-component regulator propeller domain-containing protein, partial [Gillisia sp.]
MGYFKIKFVFFVLLIVVGFGNVKSLAQEIPKIEKLSEINGDFQKINAVQKDSLGNLWIASDTHIERYNSYQSEFFDFFKGLPEGTGKINTVYIDAKNQIWVGAENGLLKYSRPKGYFEAIPSERPSTQTNVQQITEDETGTLWLGCRNGIWNYSGKNLVLVSIFPAEQSVNHLMYVKPNIMFGTSMGVFSLKKDEIEYKKISLPGNKNWNIQSLLFTGDFYLIGTQNDGLYKTNTDFSITEKIYSLPYSSQKMPISGLSMDSSGNFYVATQGDGLLILDKDLRLVSHFLQQNNNLFSLSDNNLNGLFLDKQNTLWVSTTSGQINSIDIRENNFEFIRHDPNKYSSLADNFTTAIEKDKNGNVWFGTRQGLSIWNTKNNSWQHLKNLSFTKESNIPDDIKDLHADDIHMWVATFNDGIYKVNINTFLRAQYSIDSKVKIELQKVNALLVDSNKNVWAGGEEGDLTKIKPNGDIQSFSLKGITAMLELISGDILAAGKNGVFKIRKTKSEVMPIGKLQPNAKNLPYFTINSISETISGEIVLATEGAGIVIYDAARDSYRIINKISGLPSNRIQGLIIYGKNDIWAGTSKGLVNFKLEENPKIRVFDKEDGLLSEVFTRGSFAQLDDKLAFGTFKGVSIFNPEKLKNIPETNPNIVIGSVGIYSSEHGLQRLSSLNPEKELNLTHDKNSISFNFFAIKPGNQTQLNYSWKLEGFDPDWSNPANTNNVNYANLPPGNYAFLVKARNANGKWSPVEEVSLDIKSPWWFSTNAYIGYALVFMLLLLIPFFVSRIIKKRRVKAARSSVYTNLNQEIGTPLRILLTSLEQFSEDATSEGNHRLKNIVYRLRILLEPVLSFQESVMNKKEQQAKITKISVKDYMEGMVKDISPSLSQKKMEIIVNNQWNQDFFYYDLDYLNRIFFNIISNSIRYSFEEGKIIINLIPTNRGDLKVQIADNGLGLPVEDQKVIKEYYLNSKDGKPKLNSAQTDLLYVKDFIDKIGGSIVFESSKNQGTTFTIILKNQKRVEIAAEPSVKIKDEKKPEIEKAVLPEIKGSVPVSSESIKILIAEDNDELRKVFLESFKKLGEVYEAKNGIQAYEIAARIHPDILIADFDMPGMDGLALSQALKNSTYLMEMHVYLMFSESNESPLPQNIENGRLTLIKKPVNLDSLIQLIASNLKNQISLPYVNTSLSERNSNLLKSDSDDGFINRMEQLLEKNISNNSFSVEELS